MNTFWILMIVALIISAAGFYKFIYFNYTKKSSYVRARRRTMFFWKTRTSII